MKSQTKSLFIWGIIVALGALLVTTGQGATPLKHNYICSAGPPCTGGFHNSGNFDAGQVKLHFTVAEGTPDGNYAWSAIGDGVGIPPGSVQVQNGVVTSGQDWIIWHTPGFTWPTATIGIVTVSGSAHVRVASGSPTGGFYLVNGNHYCCCENGCTPTITYTDTVELVIGEGPAADENQTKECDAKTDCSGSGCSGEPMAKYSIHLLLASLHIEDTPISYTSPRGPSTAFKVVYNQREANQPASFNYSNLGPKWTFNWLSYVTDDGPSSPPANPSVYVRGGGTETFSGYNSSTQSYTSDRQTLAVLVWMGNGTYEKRFPDGSKEVFGQIDESTTPRRVFLSSVVDAAGNPAMLRDHGSRITSITDSLGQSTSLEYDENDPFKIVTVTDPFGRSAHFEYNGEDRQLSKITDPIGIESEFEYEVGTDFIKKMTTPYGATAFARGEIGTSVRWLEATDPQGGKERVEYNEAASNIASSETSAPPGVYNNDLQFRNTFYWSKIAMSQTPGDYSKAEQFHWLATPDGKISGVRHSQKKALESRVRYTYEDQTDPTKVGKNALPIKIARIVTGGATELSQYTYNPLGNVLKETDPVGRVKTFYYATNNSDVLAVYQRNPAGASLDPDGQSADKIAAYTYNSLHKPLTETDAAGQVTTYLYNPFGQVLTRTNAKGEITTYAYGDGNPVPVGYLASITSPAFNNVSAVTTFGYDSARRVRTVTNYPDQYTVTTDYDDIDRKTYISYPDSTWEQFTYVDFDTGALRLDVTEVSTAADAGLTATTMETGKWTRSPTHSGGRRSITGARVDPWTVSLTPMATRPSSTTIFRAASIRGTTRTRVQLLTYMKGKRCRKRLALPVALLPRLWGQVTVAGKPAIHMKPMEISARLVMATPFTLHPARRRRR